MKLKKAVTKAINKYSEVIHEEACNLLDFDTSLPKFEIKTRSFSPFSYNPRENVIEVGVLDVNNEFKKLKKKFPEPKPKIEEYVAYSLEEEITHYVHGNLNPKVFSEDEKLLKYFNAFYLRGDVREGDKYWYYFNCWRAHIEGIGKFGKKFIREKIDYPRKSFDEIFKNNLLKAVKRKWNFTKKNLIKMTPEECSHFFTAITSTISDFMGRKLSEKWNLNDVRRVAREKEYYFEAEILEETINELFPDFPDLFKNLRGIYILHLKSQLNRGKSK